MLEFYVMNNSFEILAIVDNYKSAIWTERYYESGDFELYLPATDDNLKLFKKHQIIVRVDDISRGMIVEKLRITTSIDEGNYLIVSGRSLSSILSRRIIWKQTTFSGLVENTIRRIVTESLVTPDDNQRAITNFTLGASIGLEDKLKIQFTGDNVEEAIQKLCVAFKIGYRVKLNIPGNGFIFEIYKGVDRTYNQNVVPYVVFSENFDNLLTSDYSNDQTFYKNVAQIAGEGEGTSRKKVTVGQASGINRFETFVNASDLSTNDGEVTTTDYENLLKQRGNETLAELASTESIDSQIAPNQTYKLNEDYFLGDLVEIINEYGASYTPRITEVIECQDETGFSCIPTFAVDEDAQI